MVQQARDTSTGHSTRERVRTKLARIAKRARNKKQAKFCSLNHLMCKSTLREAFRRLSGKAAPGIDGQTKKDYEENLERNITKLHNKLKTNSFRPNPVRRKYIDKVGSNKKRPLGIPAIEDKIVQTSLVIILEKIYEEDFLSLSLGFRPGKSQHDALKKLSKDIGTGKVNYVIDADIKGYFDNVNHEWMMKFIGHRITDTKILRLIKRFLKAGIMEEGEYIKTEKGVPQGGILSPLLANVYLHYVADLWFDKIVTKYCKGEAYMTRYADDIVFCFQYKREVKGFYKVLQKRLAKFNLQLSKEKTKIIKFGRFAERDVKRKGGRKPETFDFLGITHYCGRSRKGNFKIKWKTSRKKFHAKVNEFREWIKENRDRPLKEIWKKVNSKLRGHYQYYGVSDNWNGLLEYRNQIIKLMYKWLNRRSQRKSFNWDKFKKLLNKYPLEKPKHLINLNSAFV